MLKSNRERGEGRREKRIADFELRDKTAREYPLRSRREPETHLRGGKCEGIKFNTTESVEHIDGEPIGGPRRSSECPSSCEEERAARQRRRSSAAPRRGGCNDGWKGIV